MNVTNMVWKKYQKLIVGRLEKTGNFNSRGVSFLSFSNLESYSIKNICVNSKSEIKTKVINKQNLKHFKMINRRLFIHKFCNNSKCCCHSPGQHLLERLCFRFHIGPTFLRLSTCVFRFY